VQSSGDVSIIALQFASVGSAGDRDNIDRGEGRGASKVVNHTEMPDRDVKVRELTLRSFKRSGGSPPRLLSLSKATEGLRMLRKSAAFVSRY